MMKIQVLGKGYHPRIGYVPKWTPFWADKNTVGWLLATSTFRIRFFNPDTNKMEDMTRKNYVSIFNGEYTKPVPPVIPKEVYEKDADKPPTPEPPPSQDPEQPQPPNPDPGEPPGKVPNEEGDLEAVDEPSFIHERQDKDFVYCNNCESYSKMNPDIEDGKLVLYKNTLVDFYARINHIDGKLEMENHSTPDNFHYETYKDPKLKRTRTKPVNRVERKDINIPVTKSESFDKDSIDFVENSTCGIISSVLHWNTTDILPFEQKYFNYKNCPYNVSITGTNEKNKNLEGPEPEEDHKRELEGNLRYGSIHFFGFPNPELSSDFSPEEEMRFKMAYIGVKGGTTSQNVTVIPFTIKDKTFTSWYDIAHMKWDEKSLIIEKGKIKKYSKDFTQVNLVYEGDITFAVGDGNIKNPRFFEVPEGKLFTLYQTMNLKRSTFFVRRPYEPKVFVVDKNAIDSIHEYRDREMRNLYVTTHYLDETHVELEQRSLMNRFVYDIDSSAIGKFLSDRGESTKSANIMGHYWNDITSGCTSEIWIVALKNGTIEKDPILKKALWANYKRFFDVNKAPH